MPKVHQFLSKIEIVDRLETLDFDDLSELNTYTSETRGDDAYRMKASEWFRKRRLKARAPRPARAAGERK